MSYQQKDMSGILFPTKEADTSYYDYTGWCFIHGEKYGLRCTIKRSEKTGNEYYKLESNDGLDGAMFLKEKKSDRHPDFDGNVKIGDDKFWLSAWINEFTKAGKPSGHINMRFNEPKENYLPVDPEDVPFKGTPVADVDCDDNGDDGNLPF